MVSWLWAVVLAVVAFGAGVGLALWMPAPAPPPPAPEPPRPPPQPPTGRFGAEAMALAVAVHPGADEGRLADTGAALAAFANEAWGSGVSDLRTALCRGSGLPPALLDQACTLALEHIEGRP